MKVPRHPETRLCLPLLGSCLAGAGTERACGGTQIARGRRFLSESPGRSDWCSPDGSRVKLCASAAPQATQQMSLHVPSLHATQWCSHTFVLGRGARERSGSGKQSLSGPHRPVFGHIRKGSARAGHARGKIHISPFICHYPQHKPFRPSFQLSFLWSLIMKPCLIFLSNMFKEISN